MGCHLFSEQLAAVNLMGKGQVKQESSGPDLKTALGREFQTEY